MKYTKYSLLASAWFPRIMNIVTNEKTSWIFILQSCHGSNWLSSRSCLRIQWWFPEISKRRYEMWQVVGVLCSKKYLSTFPVFRPSCVRIFSCYVFLFHRQRWPYSKINIIHLDTIIFTNSMSRKWWYLKFDRVLPELVD